ncbi:MAG: ribonuclease III [Oscillospiraceae bacterium]|nr:ribonuclease III [Oscillospiraceae bacterium]
MNKHKNFSPLTLAFLGDSVFELLVREKIVSGGDMPVSKLHSAAVKYVCSDAQAKAFRTIELFLTAEELDIFRRGRNANGSTVPKNSTPAKYRTATGLEAVFGYLKLEGKNERIAEIFEMIWKNGDNNNFD